jgi:glutaredoxin
MMIKNIILSSILAGTLSFASDKLKSVEELSCINHREDITKLLNLDDNFKLMKIKNSKELNRFCEVYVLNQSPGKVKTKYELIYVDPVNKILLTGVTMFKKTDSMFMLLSNQYLSEFHKEIFNDKKRDIIKYFEDTPAELTNLIKNSISNEPFVKGKYLILEFVNTRCGYCKKQNEYLESKKISTNKLYVPTIASAEEMIKEVPGLKIDQINEAVKTWNNLDLSVTPTNLIIETKTNKVIDVVFGADEEKLNKYL